jgi:hypothetical protein
LGFSLGQDIAMIKFSGWLQRLLFACVAVVATFVRAHAADVEFPPGSYVGLAPPPGMTVSRNFFGFEDASNNVAIVIVALPPEAFADIDKSMTVEALQRQGLAVEGRESMSLALGKALLLNTRQEVNGVKLRKWILAASTTELTALVSVQVPDAASKDYPDDKIREALTTVAVRQTVPANEQLSLLPFQIGELAGFRVGGVMAGRAVMLTDAKDDLPEGRTEPHIVVAIANGGPAQAGERGEFARQVFGTIPNLKDIRVTSSEPLRIGGQQGHQIMAQGKDAGTGADITIVQWLRFGSGAYLHFVGIARNNAWTAAYGRFRQVRDGIDTR